jgi:hypothetical protein
VEEIAKEERLRRERIREMAVVVAKRLKEIAS